MKELVVIKRSSGGHRLAAWRELTPRPAFQRREYIRRLIHRRVSDD
jgi:hypothetical protein